MQRIHWLLAGSTILIAVMLMYQLIGEPGVSIQADSWAYLRGGLNIAQGHGYTLDRYDYPADERRFLPIRRHQPMLSIVYAAVAWLGVPFDDVPSVVGLLCWTGFLVGTGLLIFKLSQSPWLTIVGLILTSATYAHLRIFQMAMSEIVFLPLLVWVMVVLVDLQQREQGVIWRLVVVTIMLAMLMVTRYVGVLVLGAVGLWWLWCRVYQGRWRRGVAECALLSTSLVTLVAWVLRNSRRQGAVFGAQLEQGQETFMDGLLAVAIQTSQVIIPTLRPVGWYDMG